MIKVVIEFASAKQKTDPSFVYVGDSGTDAEAAMESALEKSNGTRVELHNLGLPYKKKVGIAKVKKTVKKKAK